jgi:hypothetical protein
MTFKYEKDLVNELVTILQEDYNIKYVVRELQNGKNIADIVYSKELKRDFAIFDEYIESYYYFNEIIQNKKKTIEELNIKNKDLLRKFKRFLKKLEKAGYITLNNNKIHVIKKVDIASKNVVAIEAKLSDWKSGLNQALAYKQYSDYVYVAIDEYYYKKVDIQLFEKNNVGLILVGKGHIKKVLIPKKEKDFEVDIKYYMIDKFLTSVHATSM